MIEPQQAKAERANLARLGSACLPPRRKTFTLFCGVEAQPIVICSVRLRARNEAHCLERRIQQQHTGQAGQPHQQPSGKQHKMGSPPKPWSGPRLFVCQPPRFILQSSQLCSFSACFPSHTICLLHINSRNTLSITSCLRDLSDAQTEKHVHDPRGNKIIHI